MAVPTIERTWEFSLYQNLVDSRSLGNIEEASRRACIVMLNALTDKKKKAWGGTFTDQGSGTVRFTPTTVGGIPHVANSGLYDSSDVGLDIVFVGCNSAGNDGTFTITAVDTTSGAWVEFTNSGSPVFEADTACSVHVLLGNFTVPPTVKGTSASQTSRSYGMDGKDRWLNETDIYGSNASNKDWFVVETANGCEMLFWLDTSTDSYQFVRAVIRFSCENGFTGGTLTASPTATDAKELVSRTDNWTPFGTSPGAHAWYFNVLASNDGNAVRCFVTDDNRRYSTFFGMEPAKNPLTGGALIPWNGNNNIAYWANDNNTNVTYTGYWRVTAKVTATIDKDGSAGGPYMPLLYMTSEHIQDEAVHENSGTGGGLDWRPNQLTGETYFFPIGLCVHNDDDIKGRLAVIADLWFPHSSSHNDGWKGTWPANGGKTFARIGGLIIPWDGSTPVYYDAP